MRRYAVICLSIALGAFAAFVIFTNIRKPFTAPQENPVPISVSSGRYPEFLKASLQMDVKLENKTLWIFLANKSVDTPLPSEEPHRTIVCSIDIFDETGKNAGSYHEYFRPKNPLEIKDTPSHQIPAYKTIKFAYDITLPHGIARIRLTYEDFSKMWQSGSSTLLLDEKEVKF